MNEKISVEKILELVNQLSVDEQQQLLAHLALRKKNGGSRVKAASKQDRDEDLWYQEVVEALARELGGVRVGIPSPAVLKRLQSASYEFVEALMKQSGLAKLKVPERIAAYRVLAELLVEHAHYVAKKSGAPLSAKLTLNCTMHLAGIFDSAFPGYLASGMAYMIVRQKHGKIIRK